jgi:hypothetical protein
MQGEDYIICDDIERIYKNIPQVNRNEIGITIKTEAYIQSLVLKKEHFLRTKTRPSKMVTMIVFE